MSNSRCKLWTLVTLGLLPSLIFGVYSPMSGTELEKKVDSCARNGKSRIDLDTADGGQTTGLAGVTEKKTGWILKQKMWSWSGDDYTIFEVSGPTSLLGGSGQHSHTTGDDFPKNEAFQVTGKAFNLRNGMLFRDASGNKIAYLCKKFWTMKPTYKLFTFAPNYGGQTSTDKQKIGDTKYPLYRYAAIESKLFSFKGEYKFKRYLTNEEKVDVWEAKGKFCFKMCLDVRKSDTQEVIAQVGQTSFFQFEAASQYVITAANGVDRLDIVAFTVACEKIKEDAKKAAAANAGSGG